MSENPQKASLLFINQYYYPDLASTGQLLTQLCESLSEDYEVTVLTGFPSYSRRHVKAKLFAIERHNGVKIVRVYTSAFSRRFILGRLINYLSYFVTANFAVLLLCRRQVVIAQTDPPFIGLVALLAKWFKGSQVCIVFQDVFPEVAIALGKLQGLPIKILRRIRNLLLKQADHVIAISDGMRQQLIDRGASADKTVVQPNWIDTDLVQPIEDDQSFRRENQLGNGFLVLHSGNVGLSQDFEVILEAAEQLKSQKDILFVIVGDGARKPWLEQQVELRKLDNVRLLPYQPLEKLRYSLGAADVHLVTLKKGLENYIVPSKIYGIMGAAKPVIAVISKDTKVWKMVDQHGFGIAVEVGDAHGLKEAICKLQGQPDLRQRMGMCARKVVEEQFSLKVAKQRYHDFFKQIIANHGRDSCAY